MSKSHFGIQGFGSELLFSDVPIGLVVEAGIATTSIIDDALIEGDVQMIDNEQLSITSQAYHVFQIIHC